MNKYISKVMISCSKTFIGLTILLSVSFGLSSVSANPTSAFPNYQGRLNNAVVFAADNVEPDAVSSPTKEAEVEKKKTPSNSKNLQYIIMILLLLGFSAVALRSLLSKKN